VAVPQHDRLVEARPCRIRTPQVRASVVTAAPSPDRSASGSRRRHNEGVDVQARDFTAYGASHLGAVLVLATWIVVLLALGRVADPRDRLGKAVAIVLAVAVVPLQAVYFTPGYWDPQRTLPIQLCDLAAVAAIVALLTHHRWAAALTYYWGITLTTQAVITPDLAADFPDPVFLLFWVVHVGTVWAAVHLTWTRGIHPDWRSYGVAFATTAVWAVAVFCLNLALGSNYGYLNEKPGAASVLDLLGPWPWYVVAEVAIIASVWALMTWPWVRRSPPTS
jgi:hypothetical integral membrane protein (TIGR02206 family)